MVEIAQTFTWYLKFLWVNPETGDFRNNVTENLHKISCQHVGLYNVYEHEYMCIL